MVFLHTHEWWEWKTDIKKMEYVVGGFYDTDIRDSNNNKKLQYCLKSIKYSLLRVVEGNKGISSKIPPSIMFWNNEKHFAPPRASKKKPTSNAIRTWMQHKMWYNEFCHQQQQQNIPRLNFETESFNLS